MNVLVTGGLGFIGGHLVKQLKDLDHRVITVDLKNGADYVLDISKDDLSVISEDIDVIYHLAAQPFGRGSEIDPIMDVDYNAKGTLKICQLAKFKKVSRLVYTSTMAVYGNNEYSSETDILDPLSNYAVSKLAGEYYVKKYSKESNFEYTILRLWNTYGPGQDINNESKGIVSAFSIQVLRSNHIKVTGSLQRFRDIVYVDDVVNALLIFLSNQNRSEIYNVSNGEKITVESLIDSIIEASEKNKSDFIIENIGGHEGDQHGCVGNNKKLSDLGWYQKINLQSGLKNFLNYIKYENRKNVS